MNRQVQDTRTILVKFLILKSVWLNCSCFDTINYSCPNLSVHRSELEQDPIFIQVSRAEELWDDLDRAA